MNPLFCVSFKLIVIQKDVPLEILSADRIQNECEVFSSVIIIGCTLKEYIRNS
uniref:Uncharacterized protein n=1 Tax=Rhizophagus irregularis (strain DAOM 181602 / DAOM 197198 / MUCL 43194) TaxID=747089 RepID=U9T991_RHIID